MQIKTTWYHLTPVGIVIKKTSAGEDIEKREPLHAVSVQGI